MGSFSWLKNFTWRHDSHLWVCNKFMHLHISISLAPVLNRRTTSLLILIRHKQSVKSMAQLNFKKYRISANSFRGNYSFLKLENVEIFIQFPHMAILYFINWIDTAETIEEGSIQERKLFADIRYIECALFFLLHKHNKNDVLSFTVQPNLSVRSDLLHNIHRPMQWFKRGKELRKTCVKVNFVK